MLARTPIASIALALAGWLAHGNAWAHSTGIASSGCDGCHAGGADPMVHLTAEPSTFDPGATVTLHVAIQAINGPAGGFFLSTNGTGSLAAIAGQGTQLLNPTEVTHSTPRTAAAGFVTFDVHWTAPSTPGGAMIDVWALSANGNGADTGDGGGEAHLPVVFGCTGVTYYRDYDADGYGSSSSGSTVACSMPMGYSLMSGDCDENDASIHPGAMEICNGRDDNCNGTIDEGVTATTLYEDHDGDGYGRPGGASVTACPPPHGYGAGMGDCDDTNPAVHPGAVEICDLLDNNCNGRIDEGVRPRCGTGWCAALAYTCDPTNCRPGMPMVETCNDLDDDCNGIVDDGANLCPTGLVCSVGSCVGDGGVAGDAGDSGDFAHGMTVHQGGCSVPPRRGRHDRVGAFAGLIVVIATMRRSRTRRAKRDAGWH